MNSLVVQPDNSWINVTKAVSPLLKSTSEDVSALKQNSEVDGVSNQSAKKSTSNKSINNVGNHSVEKANVKSGVESDDLNSIDVQMVIQHLRQRDQEVRAHEMAHLAAAGSLAVGGMAFSYQTGPDGRQYAVGGEVGIEVSPGKTPEETIQKAQKTQQAALAPADPSAQDLSVAWAAMQMQMQAQRELATQRQDAQKENDGKALTNKIEISEIYRVSHSEVSKNDHQQIRDDYRSAEVGKRLSVISQEKVEQAAFLTRLALQGE